MVKRTPHISNALPLGQTGFSSASLTTLQTQAIGAVQYLNTKPLVHGLASHNRIRLSYDLPSRLADRMAAKQLDVALIPSIELFRGAGYRVVSDACIGCRGPVMSVKLFFRTAPKRVLRLAVDEGAA